MRIPNSTSYSLSIRKRIYLPIVVLLTLLYWLLLSLQIHIVESDYWIWKPHITPLPWIALAIPFALAAYLVISRILRDPDRIFRNLLLLILLGTALQIGVALTEGRGIDALRDRMVFAGHAEFAVLAATQPDLRIVAGNYAELISRNPQKIFLQTKPPGQLLFYILTQKLSVPFFPADTNEERYYALITFAGYFYPFLTYLTIIPLYFVSRHFLDEQKAYFPPLLYIFAPNVALITMHLDQTLYPLFATGIFLLALLYCTRRSLAAAFMAGILSYLAIYVSFSLLLIVPLALAFMVLYRPASHRSDFSLRQILIPVFAFVSGFVLLYLSGWMLFDYDVITRYRSALAFHVFLKDWSPGLNEPLYFAFFNFFEFFWWLGPPLACFFFATNVDSVSLIGTRKLLLMEWFSLLIFSLFLLLGFFGRTKGEVGRLWIFLVPFVCLTVSGSIVRWFPHHATRCLWLLIVLQSATILVVKHFQDM